MEQNHQFLRGETINSLYKFSHRLTSLVTFTSTQHDFTEKKPSTTNTAWMRKNEKVYAFSHEDPETQS